MQVYRLCPDYDHLLVIINAWPAVIVRTDQSAGCTDYAANHCSSTCIQPCPALMLYLLLFIIIP
jgi:hypothetical protein